MEANESYEQFAASLQKKYEEDSGISFGVLEKHSLANLVKKTAEGDFEYIGVEASESLYQHFIDQGYLDEKGKVQDKLKVAPAKLPTSNLILMLLLYNK